MVALASAAPSSPPLSPARVLQLKKNKDNGRQVDHENEIKDKVAGRTLPALMLGFASVVILCSLGQLVRDRCILRSQNRYHDCKDDGGLQVDDETDEHSPNRYYAREIAIRMKRKVHQSPSSTASGTITQQSKGTSAKSDQQATIHRSNSAPEVRQKTRSESHSLSSLHRLPHILPPLPLDLCEIGAQEDDDDDDDLSPFQDSLSRVSTLTCSLAGESIAFGGGELCVDGPRTFFNDCCFGGDITNNIKELSDRHRVGMTDGGISKLLAKAKDEERRAQEPAAYSSAPTSVACAECTDDDDHTLRNNHSENGSFLSMIAERPNESAIDDDSSLHGVAEASPSTTGPCNDGHTDNSITSLGTRSKESQLIGESCLKGQNDDWTPQKLICKPSPSLRSLEFSPDGPEDDFVGRDIAIIGKLLFGNMGEDESSDADSDSSTEFEEGSDGNLFPSEDIDLIPSDEFKRDIFFVPVSKHLEEIESDGDTIERALDVLGLRIADASCGATHPIVYIVKDNSPLRGRIFEGDFILKVNGKRTRGFSASDVVNVLLKNIKADDDSSCGSEEGCGEVERNKEGSCPLLYQMIHLTILSSRDEPDTDTDDCLDDDSFDTGIPASAVEV